jgi:hypothetical protein
MNNNTFSFKPVSYSPLQKQTIQKNLYIQQQILEKEKSILFWQYPVITEKTFFEQNKHNPNYIPVPWATFIDKSRTMFKQSIIDIFFINLKNRFSQNKNYYTCCQHIHFRTIINYCKRLNIKKIYTPHKCIGKDYIDGIEIKSCPLYAVNIEDSTKNNIFRNVDFLNKERKYLYSFIGGWDENFYLTDIRPRIFKMKHPKNTLIQNTGMWHFDKVVGSEKQNYKQQRDIDPGHINKTDNYNKILLESRYSLCPSGSGPNSIRLWESLAVGSIPILLADTLELPHHELWENTIIRVPEAELDQVPKKLEEISLEKEKEMRENCLKIYQDLKNNYKNE